MGCNPGDVSIWVKVGINEIWKKKNNTDKLPKKSFAEMAQELGIQTIHISERDTQITSNRKKQGEYCNTWSSLAVSYYEELLGCVEASWGTHEDKKHNGMESVANENNYLTWKKIGAYVQAQSWVPTYGRYIGNIVRHDEAYTIGRELTIPGKYCPSVYYVYHPTDETIMSVYELKEKNNEYQENFRLLTSDITDGNDLLGLTYYLADGTTYFIGSLLNIHEAREIYNNKHNDIVNATNVPVVIGYLSGVIYLMDKIAEGKKVGLLCPDELPYEEIMNYQLPFIGDFVFVEGNYKMITSNNHFDDARQIIHGDWTFDKFLIHHD
jgi:homospermidine synthase